MGADVFACRLCGAPTDSLGTLRPYTDYETVVYACNRCRARMARHDLDAAAKLHASAQSSYAWHRELAARAGGFFERRERQGLRVMLDNAPKNRLVLGELDRLPPGSRVLEVGCSRGYLTAYALLCGHDVLGVDISEEAVQEARRLFGDHFVVVGSPRIEAGVPYDLVYHVGTIGCVSDPVGLLRAQLELLRPGGRVVFNAPNVAAAAERHRLWHVSTTPPDVVTLFESGWFARTFSTVADVKVTTAFESPAACVRRALGRDQVAPENSPRFRLYADARPELTGQPEQRRSALRHLLGRTVGVLDSMRLLPRYAHEFGILVSMVKR